MSFFFVLPPGQRPSGPAAFVAFVVRQSFWCVSGDPQEYRRKAWAERSFAFAHEAAVFTSNTRA